MKNRIILFFVLLMISTSIYAQKVMRIGIIGLDTSHSTAFTELINSGSDETFSKGFRVVAAYPYGSKKSQNPAVIYPIYELGAYSSSFLLKESPFKSQAVTAKGYENPAVDYLYVYWMSRYMGLEK
jgi:hypothetical protein